MMTQNVWAWPVIVKLTTCLRPNIINILVASMNKNKLTDFMNFISDKLHIWYCTTYFLNSFKDISGMVQIKNNCQLCAPQSSENPTDKS